MFHVIQSLFFFYLRPRRAAFGPTNLAFDFELTAVLIVGPQAARIGHGLHELTSTLHIVQHGSCPHVTLRRGGQQL